MLHILSGGSQNDPEKYYGKKIKRAWMEDDRFNIDFTDGVKVSIWDNGQSCCEHRYMRTDDDLGWLKGKKLEAITTKEAHSGSGEYDTHEIVFLEIMTNEGEITFSNHNVHNGYYGGFGLTITERQ